MTVKELQDLLSDCDPEAKIEIFDIDLDHGISLTDDYIEYSELNKRLTIYI